MKTRLVTIAIPTLLAVFSPAPAFAQVQLGLHLGPVHIRISPEAPPPPRVEIRAYRPSRNYVWIAGYWDRQDDRWAWAPGRWEEPGQPGSQWVRPRYQREDGAYRYEPGHWSYQRMEEGADYSRWRNERGRGHNRRGNDERGDGRGHGRDNGRDDGRDHGGDRGRDNERGNGHHGGD